MITQRKLRTVNRPLRYLGGEMGQHIKPGSDIRIGLLVPTVYEEAMSNSEVITIYNNINSMDGIWVERIFTPMPDYENILRRYNIPFTTIESETELNKMQIILVHMDDVMQITNALNVLNLAKIPILNQRRDATFPLVIFSGRAMLNPKPFLKFADAIICGETENVLEDILEIYKDSKFKTKEDIINTLEKLPYIYTNLNLDKKIKWYIQDEFRYTKSKKNIVPSIDIMYNPNTIDIVKGNKFEQGSFVYGKYIEKENPIFEIKDKIDKTGEKKITIDTKNLLDFEIVRDIIYRISQEEDLKNNKITITNAEITKNNLWALKYIEGKARIILDDRYSKIAILDLVKEIFETYCFNIQLIYTIGKPKENYEELIALLSLAEKILETYSNMYPNSSKLPVVDILLIPFVPLINTGLQWCEMSLPEKVELKLRYIKDANKNECINIVSYDTYIPCIKTMILRGNVEVGNIIYDAWKNGAKLDNFEEMFRKEPWEIALNKNKKSLKSYLEKIETNEVLPWDNIEIRTEKQELLNIYEREIK